MDMATAQKYQGSHVPVHARVHYDMHQCISRFAARLEYQQQQLSSEEHEGGVSCRHPISEDTCGAMEGDIVQSASGAVERDANVARSSWQTFREIWREMRFEEVFLTARSHGRSPPCDETTASYTQLLLAVGVRQIGRNAHGRFASRLGSLYLLFALYTSQPTSPPTTAPVDETQWNVVRELISEMRDLRHAEGFRAIHTLCTEGAFKHLKSSSIWAQDLEAMQTAEREADEIGVNLACKRAQAGGCMQLVFQIQQSLADLEPAYEESKAAILSQRSLELQMASPMLIDALDEVGEHGDERSDHGDGASLHQNEEGGAPPPATSSGLLPQLSAGHATRQMMRRMAYNPRKRSRGNN